MLSQSKGKPFQRWLSMRKQTFPEKIYSVTQSKQKNIYTLAQSKEKIIPSWLIAALTEHAQANVRSYNSMISA